MGRTGGTSDDKQDKKQYAFDSVLRHKMKRGKPVFIVRWSHPWNVKEEDSELDTTNYNDRAGILAKYCKKHGLIMPTKRKRGSRGKVEKKQAPPKVQKKKEVKIKPSWYYEEIIDNDNGKDGKDGKGGQAAEEASDEEEEAQDSLPDVNQRQPPALVPAAVPAAAAQVAQVAPVAQPAAVQAVPVAQVPAVAQPMPAAHPAPRFGGMPFSQAHQAAPRVNLLPPMLPFYAPRPAQAAVARAPPAPAPSDDDSSDDDHESIYLSDG